MYPYSALPFGPCTSFVQFMILVLRGCFNVRLIEIGPIVPEKKSFKAYMHICTNVPLFGPTIRPPHFICTIYDPCPQMIQAKFD